MQPRMKLEDKSPGRWAISRTVNGKTIALIQDTRVTDEAEVETVLRALGLHVTPENLYRYFPKDRRHHRCPTYALIALWYDYGQEGEYGLSTSV